jgi:hypothetical protein
VDIDDELIWFQDSGFEDIGEKDMIAYWSSK